MNHAGEVTPDGFPVDYLTGAGEKWEGRVVPPKSLAIVGSHPATRQLAPYEDPNFDIWLFNESPQKPEIYRRWDASFQMHKPEVYTSLENWVNKDHWEWLQQDHGDKTIWMMEVDPRVPNSKRYPIEEILAMTPYHYLRSTPAMALALAIHLGYRHIQIYGSELSSNTEYGYQAINFSFWIGFAHGYGVNLELRCWESEFFDQPLYGYEGEVQIPKESFEKRIEHLEDPAYLNSKALERVSSRLEDALYNGKFNKFPDLFPNFQSLAMTAGEANGALDEAKRYNERTNPISRQEFERVSAQAQMDAQKVRDQMKHLEGVCEYVFNVWKTTGNTEARNQLKHFAEKMKEAALETGRQTGIMRENLQYIAEYDDLVTAAGGSRAVNQAEYLHRKTGAE